MWISVRDALSILLGGNLEEVAFTIGAGLLSGREALNTRQLLLVNLLTDVLPAMAVAVRPPPDITVDQLIRGTRGLPRISTDPRHLPPRRGHGRCRCDCLATGPTSRPAWLNQHHCTRRAGRRASGANHRGARSHPSSWA